jgi:hypothetical protein
VSESGIRHDEVTLINLLPSERLFPHAGACYKARPPKPLHEERYDYEGQSFFNVILMKK